MLVRSFPVGNECCSISAANAVASTTIDCIHFGVLPSLISTDLELVKFRFVPLSCLCFCFYDSLLLSLHFSFARLPSVEWMLMVDK